MEFLELTVGLSKTLEQCCEMSLRCLASLCLQLSCETGCAPCLSCTETALCQSLFYISAKSPPSFGLSLTAALVQKNLLQSHSFTAWKNTFFLCTLFPSTELCFKVENFPGSALCPSQTHLKAPGTLQQLHFVSLQCPRRSTCAEFPSIWPSLISICWRPNASLIWEINHT